VIDLNEIVELFVVFQLCFGLISKLFFRGFCSFTRRRSKHRTHDGRQDSVVLRVVRSGGILGIVYTGPCVWQKSFQFSPMMFGLQFIDTGHYRGDERDITKALRYATGVTPV